jgi:hypothetical protein
MASVIKRRKLTIPYDDISDIKNQCGLRINEMPPLTWAHPNLILKDVFSSQWEMVNNGAKTQTDIRSKRRVITGSHTLQLNSDKINKARRTIQYEYASHIDEKSAETDGENSAHQWPTHGKA